MQNPQFYPVCSNHVLNCMYLIHMYYIFISDKNIYKPIKEKIKLRFSPTTLTTLLKAPPPLIKM